MPLPFAAIAGGMALAGGVAGALGNRQEQTTRRQLDPAGALENQTTGLTQDTLSQLQGLVNQGPGSQDVQAGVSSQRSLAEMLQQMMQTGGMPSQADTTAAQGYAQQAFQGQQNSLNNAFLDQGIQASRAQARSGRGGFDPILQNKMAVEQTRQQGQLAADQGSFAAQFAQQMPGQRLGFAQQFAGVQSGLASQAMSNRQTLLGLGQQVRQGEQNFRLGSATTSTSQSSPGGFMGALTGALGGASAGMGMATAFGGGGGGGGVAAPAAGAGVMGGATTMSAANRGGRQGAIAFNGV